MPVHDWTRVHACIFHSFHCSWVVEISRALNRGILPPDYYALMERINQEPETGLRDLEGPADGGEPDDEPPGAIARSTAPPTAHFQARTEVGVYAARASSIVIRHTSRHQAIAVVQLVSPGNKNSRYGLRSFVDKAREFLRAGLHLLVVDLFPPMRRDPAGIPGAIWDEFEDNDFALSSEQPLSLGAFIGGPCQEVFLERTAVGAVLPDWPLFLTPEYYISVPLEATYQSAWEAVPTYWRDVLTAPDSV
jgi:hypothetical protein